MPIYPDDSALIRFGGPMGSEESWSCGIRAMRQGLAGDVSEFLDDVKTAVSEWHARADSEINGAASLGWVTITTIGRDGKQIEDVTPRFEFEPVQPAPTSAGPFQLAYCVTFRTAKPRGRAASGRIYVPHAGGGVDKSGYWFNSSAQKTMRSAVTLLQDLTGAGAGLTPSIISGVDGTHNAITRVEVGNVLDTQRRRRRSLKEVYVGADL